MKQLYKFLFERNCNMYADKISVLELFNEAVKYSNTVSLSSLYIDAELDYDGCYYESDTPSITLSVYEEKFEE